MWLRALNHDTAFELTWPGGRAWLDPWLSASQVDGVAWFSRQSHVQPVTPVTALAPPDVVIVALPFTDHCDRDTLCALPPTTRVVGPPAVVRKIAGWRHFAACVALPPDQDVAVAGLTLRWLPARGWLDLVHAGLLVRAPEASIFYAPHGFDATDPRLDGLSVEVALVTPVRYALPAVLGGVVNLGVPAAVALADRLRARVLIPCHAEPKRAEGLVARLARTDYDWEDRLGAARPPGCEVRAAPWGEPIRLP